MSFEEIVYGQTDGQMHTCTTDDGQNVITKAYLVTTDDKQNVITKARPVTT